MSDEAKIRVGALIALFVVIIFLLFRRGPDAGKTTVVKKGDDIDWPSMLGAQYANANLDPFAGAIDYKFGNIVQKGCGCFSCSKNRSIAFSSPPPPALYDLRPAADNSKAVVSRIPIVQSIRTMVATWI